MRLLVTFALSQECGPWLRRGGFRARGDRIYQRQEAALELVVVETGMGAGSARRKVREFLQSAPVDLVVNSGFAGGLKRGLMPGTVLVARVVREHPSGRQIAPCAEWVAIAEQEGARPAVFLTAADVAATPEKKRQLGALAEAVEMESFAVLEEAAECGIPAVAIRAVSDGLEDELPLDFSGVLDERGRIRKTALAVALFRRPAALSGLARLAKDSRRAATVLGEFLERYVKAASATAHGQVAVGSSSEV